MDVPRNWRLRGQRYRLEGSRCERCATIAFPPRQLCRECRGREHEPVALSGRGTLYTYTTMYGAPNGYEGQLPYIVAIVELDEGPRLTAMLTDVDPDGVRIGMPLEMVVRKIVADDPEGPIHYGYKFRPIDW